MSKDELSNLIAQRTRDMDRTLAEMEAVIDTASKEEFLALARSLEMPRELEEMIERERLA
jgi:hypothetical protein